MTENYQQKPTVRGREMATMSKPKETAVTSTTRLIFIDNIRIYLMIVVIFTHTAIGYGGLGDWGLQEPATDEISPIILSLFNAVNQSYFMAAFFFFAGYFTPRSFEKKGAQPFLLNRLIRLGIPILVYTTLIININRYILDVIGRGHAFEWLVEYDPGPLWFLQALLIFAALYVLYRVIAGQSAAAYFQNSFPPNRILWICIGALTVLTFLVRFAFPVGEWIFNFQLAHFVHYIFSFSVGVLAYRGDWLRHVPIKQARRWGWLALGVIPLFLPLFILGGALENEANITLFLGGPHWQAFGYALWETILLIAINVFLLYFFRQRFNHAGTLLKSMAASVFTVYIIHQTILYLVQVLLLSVSIPTTLKFFIAGAGAVLISFLLSVVIRRIPYTKRVLG